ncbi:MAG: transposase [Thermoanaerobaculia bacterium]
MSRRLRFVPPQSLVEVTCRTVHGRFLLSPLPEIVDATLGILARAARLSAMPIHAFVFLSNHYHLLVTPTDAHHLAAFMGYLNSNLAREIGRLVHWREAFWSSRYHAILVSEEEGAQIDRLRYLLSHGCKENLVLHPQEWPGASGLDSLLSGAPMHGTWRDRTLEGKAARRGVVLARDAFVSTESLSLVPLPAWAHLNPEEQRARIEDLVSTIDSSNQARLAETQTAPLGVERLLRQPAHQEANRRRRTPAPLVHAISPDVRRRFREQYRRFFAAFRLAAQKWKSGAADALTSFPQGCFPPFAPFVPVPSGG